MWNVWQWVRGGWISLTYLMASKAAGWGEPGREDFEVVKSFPPGSIILVAFKIAPLAVEVDEL